MNTLKAALHKAIDEVDDNVLEAQFSSVMSGRIKKGGMADLALEMLEVIRDLFDANKLIKAGQNLTNPDDVTTAGKPMTVNQLKERISTARAAIKKGDFTSHDDLKRESSEW